jgi:hypothetical protein
MLRSAKDLFGTKIAATDGDIGSVNDFLFDDGTWTVRYMAADTAGWLRERLVLISPVALGQAEWEAKRFPVNLTRQQVEDSPPIESDMPVGRRHEVDLNLHYGWPQYWGGGLITAGSLGGFTQAAEPPVGVMPRGEHEEIRRQKVATREDEDREHPELRSVREVSGYAIAAEDGDIGHVDDVVIDDEDWSVRYVVVDTGDWLSGRKVLMAPGWIKEISWDDGSVRVDLAGQRIKDAPEYSPGQAISREYEEQLHEHYGRDPYWGRAAAARLR